MTHIHKNPTQHSLAPTSRLRRALGMFCLVVGIVGCILPILPGLPFLVISARLLGPRDPALRRLLLGGRSSLRSLRTARHPRIRRIGVQLTPHWQRLTRLLVG
ncbi:MAG: DUF454 family protein [Chloroflexales bacterium]|nr:DUF454 family protein [Chloroflexales bacterium]